ncbi:MAG: hypothetical protein ACUVV3_04515, partial [Dehalococcoidia bacterium]
PIGHLFDFVQERVGVQEVDGPPPAEVPISAPAESVAPEEAAHRLALAIRQPSYLPEGFQFASSLYYPQGLTSPERGTFVLVYTLGGVDPQTLAGTKQPRLLIYQERTSADSMAVMNGEAEQVMLAGHVPATYARALWTPGQQGTLEGADLNAQSLFFNNGDVRVMITYRNGGQEKEQLVRIAESMLSQ